MSSKKQERRHTSISVLENHTSPESLEVRYKAPASLVILQSPVKLSIDRSIFFKTFTTRSTEALLLEVSVAV